MIVSLENTILANDNSNCNNDDEGYVKQHLERHYEKQTKRKRVSFFDRSSV